MAEKEPVAALSRWSDSGATWQVVHRTPTTLEDLNLGKVSELLKLGTTAVSFITALNSLR